jgi:hypothetical protein
MALSQRAASRFYAAFYRWSCCTREIDSRQRLLFSLMHTKDKRSNALSRFHLADPIRAHQSPPPYGPTMQPGSCANKNNQNSKTRSQHPSPDRKAQPKQPKRTLTRHLEYAHPTTKCLKTKQDRARSKSQKSTQRNYRTTFAA